MRGEESIAKKLKTRRGSSYWSISETRKNINEALKRQRNAIFSLDWNEKMLRWLGVENRPKLGKTYLDGGLAFWSFLDVIEAIGITHLLLGCYLRKGGSIEQWLAYLPLDPAALSLIPSQRSQKIFRGKNCQCWVWLAVLIRGKWFWIDNVDQTHLVLASGKLVQKGEILFQLIDLFQRKWKEGKNVLAPGGIRTQHLPKMNFYTRLELWRFWYRKYTTKSRLVLLRF